MKKDYSYPDRLYWGMFSIPVVSITLWLIAMIHIRKPGALLEFVHGRDWFVYYIVTIMYFGIAYRMWFSCYLLSHTRYVITNESIIHICRNITTELRYTQIRAITFSPKKTSEAWIQIATHSESIRINSTLENFEDLLITLRSMFQIVDGADIYSEKMFGEFHRLYIYRRTLSHILYSNLFSILMSISCFLVSCVFLSSLMKSNRFFFYVWLLLGAFFSILYCLVMLIVMAKLYNNSIRRDTGDDQQTLQKYVNILVKRTTLIFWCLYIVSILVLAFYQAHRYVGG